jgi:predicted Zn-ribbon and HTH transcriptional regulator
MLSEALLNMAKKNRPDYSTGNLKRIAKCYVCGKDIEDWDEKQKPNPRCPKCKKLLQK